MNLHTNEINFLNLFMIYEFVLFINLCYTCRLFSNLFYLFIYITRLFEIDTIHENYVYLILFYIVLYWCHFVFNILFHLYDQSQSVVNFYHIFHHRYFNNGKKTNKYTQ